ncbi:MAG: hypothetical protein K2Z81_27115 [Cyanobacteria bacterium]|nr:hypothetical protein [Cyanobacteriota bacterium]
MNHKFDNQSRKTVSIDQNLLDHADSWILRRHKLVERTEEIDLSTLNQKVTALYALAHIEPPKVVVCQSPLQMRLLPILFACQSKLDKMFTHPQGSLSINMRTNLRNLIGEELSSNLMEVFDRSFEPADEPGEFILDTFTRVRNQLKEPAFLKTKSMVPGAQPYSSWTLKYYERQALLQRHWSWLYPKIGQYLQTLTREVTLPVDDEWSGKVSLELRRQFGETLQNLSRFLSFGTLGVDHGLLDLDLANQFCDADLTISSELSALCDALSSVHLLYPFRKICFVCQFPKLIRRHNLRLHCEDGPALVYRDGNSIYCWRGGVIPKRLIEERHSVTADEINAERNIELRRLMIEVFGVDRFLKESRATPVQEDIHGILYRFKIVGLEDLVMVQVFNSTAEPDGSRKTYWLRVPPFVMTAKQGVAWSFGMSAVHYNPTIES